MITYQSEETILKIEGLNKSYDVPILRDISLEVKNITRPGMAQGQIVSLIGKSGSGKSTLFRIMAGLEEPDSGKVLVNKELVPVQEGNMGVVFQNSYLYPWRKVKKILQMAAESRLRKVGGNVILIDQITAGMDIEKLMDKYPDQISGGQRQRVAIAEQILNGGDFILLDEPFSGLDTLTIDKVTKILTDIVASDEMKTIVLVSHDLSNSLAISDTAFVLAKQEGVDGATITHQIDLASQGLAWQPDIKENPLFRDLLKQVKSLL